MISLSSGRAPAGGCGCCRCWSHHQQRIALPPVLVAGGQPPEGAGHGVPGCGSGGRIQQAGDLRFHPFARRDQWPRSPQSPHGSSAPRVGPPPSLLQISPRLVRPPRRPTSEPSASRRPGKPRDSKRQPVGIPATFLMCKRRPRNSIESAIDRCRFPTVCHVSESASLP